MSTLAARPSARALSRARGIARPGPEALFGTAVAVALAAIALRAGGGLSLGPTTKLEMILDVGGGLLAALAALAATGRRAWGAATTTWFAVLVAVTAISITWAIEPSDAWLETSRTLAYLAVFGAGVVLARQTGTWWSALLGGILGATVIVCGYAVLTKVFPGTLAPAEVYARLRDPYGYWNAVGITAALGVPVALWLGARRVGHAAVNALAYPAMGLLLLTMLLAYSRGSLLAVAIGCAFWFATVPLRLRGVAVLASGAIGAFLVSTWAFDKYSLTADRVVLDLRDRAGHQLGIATLVMLVLLLALGLAIGFATARRAPRAATRRRVGVALLVALSLVPLLLIGSLAMSSKGLGGSITSGWKSLTDPNDRTPLANDPGRLTKVGSVRARYWNESYKIWRTHKVTGVGAGGYATARPRFRKDTLAVRHAHGYVVQTAADLGIIGLLASAALLIAWCAAAARTLALSAALPSRVRAVLRRPPPRPVPNAAAAERAGLLTLTTIVIVFGVHSFVDWTWYVPATAAIALLCAGWVVGRGPVGEPPLAPAGLRRRMREGLRTPWRAAVAAFALVVALAAAWATWQPLRAVDTGNEALAQLDDAGKDPHAFDRARRLTDDARRRNPLSVEPLFERNVVETIAGDKAAARAALEEAVRLQPSNPATWMALTRFVLEQEDRPVQALRLLGPALYLDPKSAEGAAIYLQALRRTAEKQAARTEARRKARARAQAKANARKRAAQTP